MSRNVVGWGFVGIQCLLLVALLILPRGEDWPVSQWVHLAGWIPIGAGFAIIAVSVLRLGAAFTPNPVPAERGKLITTGFYRYVRHPIYTGVFLIVVSLTIQSGNWITLIVGITTLMFFDRKTRWEEARLAETFSEYLEYARRTPRFFPRLRGRIRSDS